MALITETHLRSQWVKGIPNPFVIAEGDKLTPAAADFLKDRNIKVERTDSVSFHPANQARFSIPVGVSNRHVHLSPEHVEALFGIGYRLVPLRELSQKGQFAAQETVKLIGPKASFEQVRILGPSRGASQVEISATDGYLLGMHPPLRLSGNIAGTPGIKLAGPRGSVQLNEGLIVAKNHVHMSPEEAAGFGVKNGDTIMLQTSGDRPLIFADVAVRVNERFSLDFHVDTDEANAARLKTGDCVQIIGKNGVMMKDKGGRADGNQTYG